ncbi:hypothetical protein EW146_g3617 [Bondarzewia mesenterica]|uniref:Phosphoribulokinase/uridine kinase domain-containing protein n=1 Tax=Bondarzewia mesenterica TaxID=1095465 RepID=A0A4V3XFD8_9AGAM|nr:hypothetical protein EW146_g3617 [Bondarzewia mesenterica]
MEAIAEELALHLIHRLQHTPSDARLLVGISGIPASGKSTLAVLVVNKVNTLLKQPNPVEHSVGENDAPSGHTVSAGIPSAILVGLDGWHLTRAQLDAFPDSKLAHDRRGIHWTFDGDAYVSFVKSLRHPLSSSAPAITAPSFDHALKDPTPHAITILSEYRIVVIEGLYCFLSIPPWAEAGLLLDERWFIELDVEEASKRLVKRHVLTGVAKDMEEAIWRSEQNDMPNGKFIIANMLEPTRVIHSIDDTNYSVTA